MAASGSNNVMARRVMDDLIAFSGETAPSVYTKFLLEKKIVECRMFVDHWRTEVAVSRECITHLVVVIVKFKVIDNQEEVYDALIAAKALRRGEQGKMDGLNAVIANVLEEIMKLEANMDILDGALDVVLCSLAGLLLLCLCLLSFW